MNQPTLKQEISLLRSAVAGVLGVDREGSYHPEFVAEVFSSLKRKPTFKFASREEFLHSVERS